MSRQELIDMTRSLIAHGEADTVELADKVVSDPSDSIGESYTTQFYVMESQPETEADIKPPTISSTS